MDDIYEIKEKADAILKDEVSLIMTRFVTTENMPYPEIIRLKRKIESNDSIFNPREIAWLHYNHLFWLSLLKSPKGRRIYLHLYKYNDNIYSMARKLKISRKAQYKWIKRLLNRNLLYINPTVRGNEILYCLNRYKYPNLTFFTKWFILEFIGKEAING